MKNMARHPASRFASISFDDNLAMRLMEVGKRYINVKNRCVPLFYERQKLDVLYKNHFKD